jgi:hypothetical protein
MVFLEIGEKSSRVLAWERHFPELRFAARQSGDWRSRISTDAWPSRFG